MSLLEVVDMSDLRSVFKEMLGEVLENGLETEFNDDYAMLNFESNFNNLYFSIKNPNANAFGFW